LLALCASLAANGLLLWLPFQNYLDINATRLDPLNLSYFSSAPREQSQQMTAVFFSDSRAAQWPAPTGLPAIQFVNRGIGAQTSAQIAGRFDAHIRPLQPDILIIQMGINDLKTVALFPAQQEQIIANCQDNISQVVNQATQMGTAVILTTIFPVGDYPWQRQLFWSPEIDTAVTAVNKHIHSLAADNVFVLDAHALLADKSGRLQPPFSTDELHLNSTGYAHLNAALISTLTQIQN
jgi:lysophospholipase L1-like esterase